MAKMLIGTLPSDVDLFQYTDQYSEALKKLIADKKAGVIHEFAPAPATKEVDLVEQLMASLKAAQPAGV